MRQGNGVFLYSDDGRKIEGLRHPDNTEGQLSLSSPISTWANRDSIANSGNFSAFFTDIGIGGSYWDYVGGRWRPSARNVILYNGLAPVTLSSGTKTVVDYIKLLAGVVQDGDLLEYSYLVEKDGASDTYTIDICLGAVQATPGTSLGLSTAGLAGTAKQLSPTPVRVRREGATSVRPVSVGGAQASGTNTGPNTAVTVPSLEADVYLQLCGQRTAGSTETLTSRHFAVTLISGA